MANIKINDLTATASVQDTDEIVVSQGTGQSDVKSSTLAVLRTWINSGNSGSGTVTANNGLTESAGNIQLGGRLVQDATLDTGGHQFSILSADDSTNILSATFSNGVTIGVNDGTGTGYSNVMLKSNMQLLEANASSDGAYTSLQNSPYGLNINYVGTGGTTVSLGVSNNGINIFDTVNNVGAKYGADYSAAGASNPRWIPDAGWVRSQMAQYIIAQPSLYNYFLGDSGNTNVTGNFNTAAGALALQNNTTGYFNTAIGALALKTNDTGNSNVAIGQNALTNNITGYSNTAIGTSALFSSFTSNNNIAIGTSALYGVQSGNDNIGIGNNTGGAEGNYNIYLGSFTAYNNTGSGNIFIGAYASGNGITALSNKLIIANGNVANENPVPLIQGDFSAFTVNINGTLSTTGQLTTFSIANNATQTTTAGDTGTIAFSQPEQGASYKKILIYCNAFTGTATYIFPSAFINGSVLSGFTGSNSLAPSCVSSVSGTSITITIPDGSPATGYLELLGY